MVIAFDDAKHEGLANDHQKLAKWAGKKTTATADEILLTLNALHAAPTLFDVPYTFHPHPLRGIYKGCFSVWVTKQERIIFRPDPGQDPPAVIYNFKTIKSIVIVELCTDYHDN